MCWCCWALLGLGLFYLAAIAFFIHVVRTAEPDPDDNIDPDDKRKQNSDSP
jgi:hypothetical protein